MGSYTDALMLDDIAAMLEVIQRSEIAAAILPALPNVRDMANWMVRLIRFLERTSEGGDFNVHE